MRAPDLTGKGGASASMAAANGNGGSAEQNWTGRWIVVFREGKNAAGVNKLNEIGLKVFVDDEGGRREDEVGEVQALVHATVEAATVFAEPYQIDELKRLASDPDSPIMFVKPEKVRSVLVYGVADPTETTSNLGVSKAYLESWLDTYTSLLERNEPNGKTAKQPIAVEDLNGFDESVSTWGLQATKVIDSPFSGRGVKVAVLDTGIDFTEDGSGRRVYHPDFANRTITTASLVPGVANAKDGHGHGTHCIGTACGPRRPSTLPGYGVAFEADIYAGKVLDDEGKGADGWIIAGIQWAINQGCRVISMSLGSSKNPGDPFNEAYEEIAKRALAAGTIIVAAAGNDSARPNLVAPVSGPADCPSIIAVAAVDPRLQVAKFSNGGLETIGREINLAAPGVNVYSSFKAGGHERLQGTSMATPHVAGIAGLFAEADPSLSGEQLWNTVVGQARGLPLGPRDVGTGLAQAPLSRVSCVAAPRATEVTIEQTSPITIGGGGSVGLDFDRAHYVGSAGIYVSQQDRLSGCVVARQDGKQLKNFHQEIDGNQCVIVVLTTDEGGGNPSEIRVAGAPTGRLAIGFNEDPDHFPFDNDRDLFFSAGRKVASVTVENTLTGASAPVQLSSDWRGGIKIDN